MESGFHEFARFSAYPAHQGGLVFRYVMRGKTGGHVCGSPPEFSPSSERGICCYLQALTETTTTPTAI